MFFVGATGATGPTGATGSPGRDCMLKPFDSDINAYY